MHISPERYRLFFISFRIFFSIISDSFLQDKAVFMQSSVPNSHPRLLKQVNFARTVGVKPEHHLGLKYRDPRS